MSLAALTDGHNRVITHLRLSLTDQCNFRCVYCMPPEGLSNNSSTSVLTASQIYKLVGIMSQMGITKLRLTGGEPLLRKDIIDIVSQLHTIKTLNEITLTTNASRLKQLCPDLKRAGLSRVNISLDSLNRQTFAAISRTDGFFRTMDGVFMALSQGIPVKINTVVMRDINHNEIDDFIAFALDHPFEEWRFIEFMPLCGSGWQPRHVYSLQNVMGRLVKDYNASFITTPSDSVATSLLIRDGARTARLGFITTLSNPFCHNCSRIRLTADGILRPCLFSGSGHNLKTYLENGFDNHDIETLIRLAVKAKAVGNEFFLAKEMGETLGQALSQKPAHDRSLYPAIRSIGG